MCACPALRPRWSLHARPWAYSRAWAGLRTFRRTRLPRTMPAALLANTTITCWYCLPYIHTTSAPQLTYFGAQLHSLHTCCLRVAAWVTPMPRKTRFRLVANLYRAEFTTSLVTPQGFSNAWSLLPPCPSFPGARGLKCVTLISTKKVKEFEQFCCSSKC